jgi:ribosomal protein L11 methyltransferase
VTSKKPTRWIEISVRTDGAATRAVAALFDRSGAGGSVIDVAIGPGNSGKPSPSGAVVRTYLPTNRESPARIGAIRAALANIRKRTTVYFLKIRKLRDRDWSEGWKKDYRLIRIGSRLVIVPSWMRHARRNNEIVLRLEPGLAFGSGLHPTTRLCLEALVRSVRRGSRVLDVGTGSGILAIAARKLGAARVIALDTDPDAVSVARRNGAMNGIRRGLVFRAGTISRSPIRGMDVIVVNILSRTILKMAPDLASGLAPGGMLIASGMLADQTPEVSSALRGAGLRILARKRRGEWAALLALRERPFPAKTHGARNRAQK